MTDDDVLKNVIVLIKAGKKDEARAILEPFLRKNPNHVQAWLWETELFSNEREKIKVLETCLRYNPGNPKVLQGLDFFKKRLGLNEQPARPVPTPYSPRPDAAISVSAPRKMVDGPLVVESPKHLEPVSTKKAGAHKKSGRMSPIMLNVILALTVLVVFVALIGTYLGYGYSLNRKIEKSFLENDCPGVVQQTSFVSIYPRGLFASIFTGYDQYAECRFYLNLEQAVSAANWGGAFSFSQQYLAAYPNGAFAKSMSEQAPNFLSSWSDELLAKHNYATGIEKLKQLIDMYPDSLAARPAPETITRTYISWAKELSDKQNYKESEEILQAALTYFQTEDARSEQIKQELVDLYVAWGDMLVQLGNLTGGISSYEKAGELSDGKLDAGLFIARAHLQKALKISDTKNFNEALLKVKEISDAAQAENIKTEANAVREKILTAYSFSDSPQALEQLAVASSLVCQGQQPELPIFGLDTENIRFGVINPFVKLPIERVAEKPSQLRYVICISETEEKIQTCDYVGGHYLIRIRYLWQVTLYDILDGQAVHTKSIKGGIPNACPPWANFSVKSAGSKSYGRRPNANEIMSWIEGLDIAK